MGLATGIDLVRLWDAVALAGTLVRHPVGGRTRSWWESLRATAFDREVSA
jgi:hypothetical protein